jgi:hypothetical protein
VENVMARSTWLLCRPNPDAPEGVVFWSGAADTVDAAHGGRAVVASVTLFRAEAAEVADLAAAQLLARLFEAMGPAAAPASWVVMPAAIALPSPYRPQEKAREERGRGATAEDVVALRAALSCDFSREAARATRREAISELVFEAKAKINRESKAE